MSKQRHLDMTYIDELFEFKAMPVHAFMSKCGLKFVKRQDGKTVIILTDLTGYDPDPGMSVTNSIANLATLVCRLYEILPDDAVFIEHYLYNRYNSNDKETFDLVELSWDGEEFSSPLWKHLTKEEFERMLEV